MPRESRYVWWEEEKDKKTTSEFEGISYTREKTVCGWNDELTVRETESARGNNILSVWALSRQCEAFRIPFFSIFLSRYLARSVYCKREQASAKVSTFSLDRVSSSISPFSSGRTRRLTSENNNNTKQDKQVSVPCVSGNSMRNFPRDRDYRGLLWARARARQTGPSHFPHGRFISEPQ